MSWREQIKPGDEVAILSSFGRVPSAIVKVETAGKRKIKTSDGQEWNVSTGRRWGSTDRYSYDYLAVVTRENREDMRRAGLLRRIQAVKWPDAATAQIEACLALLAPQQHAEGG